MKLRFREQRVALVGYLNIDPDFKNSVRHMEPLPAVVSSDVGPVETVINKSVISGRH